MKNDPKLKRNKNIYDSFNGTGILIVYFLVILVVFTLYVLYISQFDFDYFN